jgi:hypothetical protein
LRHVRECQVRRWLPPRQLLRRTPTILNTVKTQSPRLR